MPPKSDLFLPRPDLASAEGREAYRRELRSLAKGWRRLGFVLVCIGAALFVTTHYNAWFATQRWRLIAWTLIGLGWMIFAGVIVYRTRYHLRRIGK